MVGKFPAVSQVATIPAVPAPEGFVRPLQDSVANIGELEEDNGEDEKEKKKRRYASMLLLKGWFVPLSLTFVLPGLCPPFHCASALQPREKS
jgi:hypothetical protein